MCEFDAMLVAWMDDELGPDTGAEVERHIAVCQACSHKVAAYRKVSRAFTAYCASAPIETRPPRSRWVVWGGAVAATMAAIAMWPLRAPLEQLPLHSPKIPEAPAFAFQTASRKPGVLMISQKPAAPWSKENAPARHFAVRVPEDAADRSGQRTAAKSAPRILPSEPSIEIALPADAMFAPGALPPGVAFAADLSIGSDGSPELLRVRQAFYSK